VNRGDPKSKKAILNYKLIKKLKNYFLLEIILETGRHHQIRCQLSNIGCHIKGDIKYGAKRPNKDRSICLHSYKIEFIHPVSKKELSIVARPPKSTIWSL
jgi:23S rRNA pseudouridine1911/1915/1917 synthase